MHNNSIKFLITDKEAGKRIDLILSDRIPDCSRTNLKKIIKFKQVQINDHITISPSKKVKLNDSVFINIISESKTTVEPTKIKIDIVYEDKDILIVNKPSGMVVHPGAGNYKQTLVNALIYKYKNKLSSLNGDNRPGIVHRIDKETSGLLVVAKNNKAHFKLGKQFSDHSIKRTYQALVWGVIRPLNGKIVASIGRNKKYRQLMAVTEINGKKAITNYSTLKVFNIKDVPRISLIECNLETGRTHQIRVHMAYKGNYLLGDKQYGRGKLKFKKINEIFENKLNLLNRQALHAMSLGFKHPSTKKAVSFKSNLPNDFKKLLDLLYKLDD